MNINNTQHRYTQNIKRTYGEKKYPLGDKLFIVCAIYMTRGTDAILYIHNTLQYPSDIIQARNVR